MATRRPTRAPTPSPVPARVPALVLALVLALSGCADDGDEVAAMQAELDQRRAHEDLVDERLDELGSELDATRAQLDRAADAAALERLDDDVEQLATALDGLDEQLTSTLDGLDEQLATATEGIGSLRAAVDDGAGDREELRARIEAVAGALDGTAEQLRGAIGRVEGETAGLADQLDALQARVDAIQRSSAR